MKRLLSLLLAALVLACALSSCARAEEDSYPVTVNGTPISEEIFRYYLDEALADASLTGKNARINRATEQCIRYVAVNTAFRERGLALTGEEQQTCAERANALWHIFGTHYGSVGVSKQTFMKLRLSLAYTERLREALFGQGGASPLPEEELKAYFNAAYVGFKVLRGHLYGADVYGVRTELTNEEREAVKTKFGEAAKQINSGVAIDFTYASLISTGNDEVRQSLTTEVIAEGDPAFPAGFYGAVRSIEEDRAGVIVLGDEIYLVYRVNMMNDSDLFRNHRAECLAAVSEPYLQSEINAMCNAYTSTRRTAAVQRCYESVKEARKQ